jgi:3-(3-hydroxy-phenyl)propionate hydroxylase
MDADVAIIGCGPAGATLANLLGARGLQVLVLERDAHIYPLPRAIHFDGEVMRVFETAGLRAAGGGDLAPRSARACTSSTPPATRC